MFVTVIFKYLFIYLFVYSTNVYALVMYRGLVMKIRLNIVLSVLMLQFRAILPYFIELFCQSSPCMTHVNPTFCQGTLLGSSYRVNIVLQAKSNHNPQCPAFDNLSFQTPDVCKCRRFMVYSTSNIYTFYFCDKL